MSSAEKSNNVYCSSTEYQTKIGQLIRKYRIANNYSQTALGKRCHKTKQQISQIEKGQTLVDEYTYSIIEHELKIPVSEKPILLNYTSEDPSIEEIVILDIIKTILKDKKLTSKIYEIILDAHTSTKGKK